VNEPEKSILLVFKNRGIIC